MLFRPRKRFKDTRELLHMLIEFLREKDPMKTAYVSGAISSNNGRSVEENIAELNRYAAMLESEYDVVIDPSAVGDLEAMGHSREDALHCWCSLLASGKVGVIAMVPGWKKSTGACTEHETAQKAGLKIIYL